MLEPREFQVQKLMGQLPQQLFDLINAWREPNYCYHMSKNLRMEAWQPVEGEIEEIVIGILTCAITDSLTIQTIMGKNAHRVTGLDYPADKAHIIGGIIGLLCKYTNWVHAIQPNATDYIYIESNIEMDFEPIAWLDERIEFGILPELTKNKYDEQMCHVITGRHKSVRHDGNICLDHINRQNAIRFSLNPKVYAEFPEECTFKREEVKPETIQQWDKFHAESHELCGRMIRRNENNFCFLHKYDSRGRTYPHGYHITYMGTAFKKAMVVLADAELVEG